MKSPQPGVEPKLEHPGTVPELNSKMIALLDTDDGVAIIQEILNGGDDICGVEEGMSVSGDEHEWAHQRHYRLMNNSSDEQPYMKIANETPIAPATHAVYQLRTNNQAG